MPRRKKETRKVQLVERAMPATPNFRMNKIFNPMFRRRLTTAIHMTMWALRRDESKRLVRLLATAKGICST